MQKGEVTDSGQRWQHSVDDKNSVQHLEKTHDDGTKCEWRVLYNNLKTHKDTAQSVDDEFCTT